MTLYRLSIMGTMSNGEKWSVNPWFSPEGGAIDRWDQVESDAMAVAALGVSMGSQLRGLLSEALSYTGVRLEGRHPITNALLGVSEQLKAEPVVGLNASHLPPQAAVVLSLRTLNNTGRGRGRMYWPAVGATLSGALRLGAPTAANVANDARAYLSAVQTAMTAAASTGPISDIALVVKSPTGGFINPVNRIQVGDIIDTQRRRRDALPESYSSINFPTA